MIGILWDLQDEVTELLDAILRDGRKLVRKDVTKIKAMFHQRREARTTYSRESKQAQRVGNGHVVRRTPANCTTPSTNAPLGSLTADPKGAASADAPPPEAGAALAVAPPPKREKTTCPMDWWPSREDCESVIDAGIRGDEIAAITEDFVTRKREAGEESYCWSATFRRFCTFKIAKGYKAIYPAVRPRFRPAKKGAASAADGSSRALPAMGSGTKLKPATGAPQGSTGPFPIKKDTPEAKAWEAYYASEGRKIAFTKEFEGEPARWERTQWPPGYIDLQKRNGSWG